MSHTYVSVTPNSPSLPDGVAQFFETFYATSDTPDAHERYVDSFTKDADFIMASKRAKGSAGILEIRKGMWKTVRSRLHTPKRIFPFGGLDEDGVQEVMIFGTVAYTLLDERKAEVEWAARAELVQVEGAWKMKFYQVYLDTAAMANAK